MTDLAPEELAQAVTIVEQIGKEERARYGHAGSILDIFAGRIPG